jgi:hypothetical protein
MYPTFNHPPDIAKPMGSIFNGIEHQNIQAHEMYIQ